MVDGIHSVLLRNFRGVREGVIEGFTDVSVLVGRNNSGKSTVVEAIMRVVSGSQPADVLERNLVGYWQAVRGEATPWPMDMAYRAQVPVDIDIQLTAKDWQCGLNLRFDEAGRYTEERSGTMPSEFARNVTLFRPNDLSNRSIEGVLWPRILSGRRDKVLVQALNDIFGTSIDQIQLLPDGRVMLLLPDYGLCADAFGDGTRAALRCLMPLTATQRGLYVIEEPESHQHPASLQRFANALCTLAKAQQTQLVLTTHSAECVRAWMTASEATDSPFSLLHLKLEQGLLESRHFDRSAAETLMDSGVDLRFLDLYV